MSIWKRLFSRQRSFYDIIRPVAEDFAVVSGGGIRRIGDIIWEGATDQEQGTQALVRLGSGVLGSIAIVAVGVVLSPAVPIAVTTSTLAAFAASDLKNIDTASKLIATFGTGTVMILLAPGFLGTILVLTASAGVAFVYGHKNTSPAAVVAVAEQAGITQEQVRVAAENANSSFTEAATRVKSLLSNGTTAINQLSKTHTIANN